MLKPYLHMNISSDTDSSSLMSCNVSLKSLHPCLCVFLTSNVLSDCVELCRRSGNFTPYGLLKRLIVNHSLAASHAVTATC